MKKLLIVILISMITGTGVLAAQENTIDGLEPFMVPGDVAITAGMGSGFFVGAIDASVGVEMILLQRELAEQLPLTFGVACKVNYYRYANHNLWGSYHVTYFGGGGFATAHLGLKELDLDEKAQWLANLDFYVGLGLGFYNYSDAYEEYVNPGYNEFQMGLRSTGGLNYFLTPNIAINVEGGYYSGWGGGALLGILFKL